jgi:hypothetical protein
MLRKKMAIRLVVSGTLVPHDAFIWYYEHLYYYYCPVEESAPLVALRGAPREEKKKNIPLDLDAYFQDVNIGIALAYLYIDDGSLFRYNPETYTERESAPLGGTKGRKKYVFMFK